ncbi:unnamed protein product [Rotaria magnacalcarata]|uniref:ZMYM2-like/QRICH1 C-terminal domain-containing protein n=6 Tax=Rotaria magnacalcarata TaxID=392030 RepID=A0A815MXD3_9BILA|nr:unnamed protein product [Rotaria magnacalcarata]CAF1427254.1 unnamed protein product [Rotaria magnacalcarata]CAF2093330.1 unnamed protein product [Rotaria magnacalcarata]CAF2154777.1 unnamed protein product [Rotaria magnacalcarata]CAF2176102.1 unnamed protein product [Rotaria magnacalcarata]
MEFDDDIHFNNHVNDDINDNHSLDDIIKASNIDDDSPLLPDQSTLMIFNRRPIRSSTSRRIASDHEQNTSSNINEPDPNVFLISSDTNSHNTIRKTKHDVKRFVMYIDEQFGEQIPLHTVSAESLCRYLKHYFENTKKFDGTQYEPDTLRSFLLSIERYLKSKNYEYNLMESPLFQSCRQVIVNKREEWKKLGLINHLKQSSLSLLNTKHLTVFDRTKPDGLLLEMYVHITKLCQLSIAQLVWGDISLVDEQYLICHQHKIENQTVRLYATPHHISACPVQAYRLYATHRPPQCNTPQSPFFLMPRSTSIHPIWYKTTAAGKNLEQILQKAIQHATLLKQSSSSVVNESSLATSVPNGKRNESSSSLMPVAKRVQSLIQPLNLSVTTTTPTEDDSGTALSSPTNSLSNDVSSSSPSNGSFIRPTITPVWNESVTDILLTVAKQRDTRTVKINTLRTYLEEKLGFVEFLCLYRGFKSEPKLTFQGTPWEHYQRFLPVLFTLLTLDNTTV